MRAKRSAAMLVVPTVARPVPRVTSGRASGTTDHPNSFTCHLERSEGPRLPRPLPDRTGRRAHVLPSVGTTIAPSPTPNPSKQQGELTAMTRMTPVRPDIARAPKRVLVVSGSYSVIQRHRVLFHSARARAGSLVTGSRSERAGTADSPSTLRQSSNRASRTRLPTP